MININDMETITQTEKIRAKDLLINILSNVFFVVELDTYMSTAKKRRFLLCENNLTLDNIQHAPDDNIDLRYLKREGEKLVKNTKQLIDFRVIDKWFFICVLLVILAMFVVASSIPFIGLSILVPLLSFYLKCLNIEFATKKYGNITKYIKKHAHRAQNTICKKTEVLQVVYQPQTLILCENSASNYENEEFVSYEEIIQQEIPICNIEDLQINQNEKKILFSCLNFLKEENLIEIIDETIQKEYSNYTTKELYPLSQVDLTKLLVKCIKEQRIRIRAKLKQQDFVKNVTDNMELKHNSPLNFDSFKTEFSRRLKADSISWSTLSNDN